MEKILNNVKRLKLSFILYLKDLKEENIVNLKLLLDCFNFLNFNLLKISNMNGYKKIYKIYDGIYIGCDYFLDKENYIIVELIILIKVNKDKIVDLNKLFILLFDYLEIKIRSMEIGN